MPKGQKAFLMGIKDLFQGYNNIIVSISNMYCLKSDSPTLAIMRFFKIKSYFQFYLFAN